VFCLPELHAGSIQKCNYSMLGALVSVLVACIPVAKALREPIQLLSDFDRTPADVTSSDPSDNIYASLSRKHGRKHKRDGDEDVCSQGFWRDSVLKLVHEIPAAGALAHRSGYVAHIGLRC
jgi:hypothetical protein